MLAESLKLFQFCHTQKEIKISMANSKLRYVLFTILLLLIIGVAIGTIFYFRKEQIGREPKLVIIAMEGLKFGHIQPESMPFVTEFYKNGVHCPQMQPVFPTKTYPNLFSIATGMSMYIVLSTKEIKLNKFFGILFRFVSRIAWCNLRCHL